MSWEDTPAQGTPETDTPTGAEASPASQPTDPTQTPAPTADASGAQPTGEADAPPFHQHPRWIELQNEKRALAEQVASVQAWLPVHERFQQQGLTPEQIAEFFDNPPPAEQSEPPAPAPDPDAEFEAHLDSLGDARWSMTEQELRVERGLFNLQQRENAVQRATEEFLAKQREAEERSQLQAFRLEYQQLAAKDPVFNDPVMRDLTELVYQRYGAPANQIADLLKKPIETAVKAALAEYQQGKRADAEVPVTAGGNAVDPHPNRVNMHDPSLTEAQREAMMTSYLEARATAGR